MPEKENPENESRPHPLQNDFALTQVVERNCESTSKEPARIDTARQPAMRSTRTWARQGVPAGPALREWPHAPHCGGRELPSGPESPAGPCPPGFPPP